MKAYSVSALFADHEHDQCGLVETIPNGERPIPVFSAGSSSYQDYLVADFDLLRKKLPVSQRLSRAEDSRSADGDYLTGDQWECSLYTDR